SPGGDNHLGFHHHAIHYDRTHAHQDPVLQLAAVQHRFMTNGDIVAHDQGKTLGIIGAGVGDVQHTAVLNAAPLTDADTVHVGPDDRHWPDGTIVAQLHIAQHQSGGVYKYPRPQLGRHTLIASQIHRDLLQGL